MRAASSSRWNSASWLSSSAPGTCAERLKGPPSVVSTVGCCVLGLLPKGSLQGAEC
jgi:hypothetical protein